MSTRLLEQLRSKPVVTLATVKKIVGGSNQYASLVLARLAQKNLLRRITRNKYTALDNIYVIATNLYFPSYLSFWSASHYLGYTEQIVNTLQVVTTSRRETIRFEGYTIKFIVLPRKYFFGFQKMATEQGAVLVAENEKLLLDALLRPGELGNFDEIINILQRADLKREKIVAYLKRIDNSSLIKRAGYLLEKYKGWNLSAEFKIKDRNYVSLDPSIKKVTTLNTKWRIKQ